MQKVYQTLQGFRLGATLAKLLESRGKWWFQAREEHCSKQIPASRGLLPWETDSRACLKCNKTFRKTKKKEKQLKENECPKDAVEEKQCGYATTQRPTRNSYEFVVEEGPPCKPFGVKVAIDKTVCELRRMKNCMRMFADENKCQNLAPSCKIGQKVYPMMEALHEKNLPGNASKKVKEGCECPETPKVETVVQEKSCKPCSFLCWKPKPRKFIEEKIIEDMKPKPPMECYPGMVIPRPHSDCKKSDIDPFKKKSCMAPPKPPKEEVKEKPKELQVPSPTWTTEGC